MKKTKNLLALLLALILTLSVVFICPAASAATDDIAAVSAIGEFSNPEPLDFGKTDSIELKREQTYYYSFTLGSSGKLILNAEIDGNSNYTFSFLNKNTGERVEKKIFYNGLNNKSFYLSAGSYLLSINSGSLYTAKVTTKLTFSPTAETCPESLADDENNDVADRASAISTNHKVTGQLGDASDKEDWYKLVVSENVQLSLDRSVSEDVRLFVFSGSNLNKSLADNLYNAQQEIICKLEKGVYYIQACRYTGVYSFTPRIINAVSGLKAAVTTNSAALSWNKDSKASGYQIKQKIDGKWKHIKYRAGANANNYTVASLKRGASYNFAVRPYYTKDGVNYFGAYSFLTAKTPKTVSAPAAPTLKNTKNGVQVSWKRVTGAYQYRVFRKTAKGKWTKIADTNKAIVDKTAKNGVTYSYTIRCLSQDKKTYTSAYNTKGSTIKCKR